MNKIKLILFIFIFFTTLSFAISTAKASEVSGTFMIGSPSTGVSGSVDQTSGSGGSGSQISGQIFASLGPASNALQGTIVGGVNEGSSGGSSQSSSLAYGGGSGGDGSILSTVDSQSTTGITDTTDVVADNNFSAGLNSGLNDSGLSATVPNSNTAAVGDTIAGIRPGWLFALATVALLLIASIGYTLSMRDHS